MLQAAIDHRALLRGVRAVRSFRLNKIKARPGDPERASEICCLEAFSLVCSELAAESYFWLPASAASSFLVFSFFSLRFSS